MTAPTLCVAALLTDGSKVALIRSKKPGRAWELPGGKVLPGEDWRAAMSRETREETGLEVRPERWTMVDVLHGKPTPGAQFASVIIVARAEASGDLVAGSDAAAVGWFDRVGGHIPTDLSTLQSRGVLLAWTAERPRGITEKELQEVERDIRGMRSDVNAYDTAALVKALGEDDRAEGMRDTIRRLAATVRAQRTEGGHLLSACVRLETRVDEQAAEIAGLRKVIDAAGREEMTAEHGTIQKLCRRWLEDGQTHRDLPGVLDALGKSHAALAAFKAGMTAEVDVESEVERVANETSFAYKLASCHPDSLWKPERESWWTREVSEAYRERWRAAVRPLVAAAARLRAEVKRLQDAGATDPLAAERAKFDRAAAYMRERGERPMPCGHALENLIYGGPDPITKLPAVTKCGECLTVLQKAKAAKAAPAVEMAVTTGED